MPPPPKAKQDVLGQYAREYGLRLFVETGTFHGDTVEAMRKLFTRIISVELDPELHQQWTVSADTAISNSSTATADRC
jgi:hypothetical protein